MALPLETTVTFVGNVSSVRRRYVSSDAYSATVPESVTRSPGWTRPTELDPKTYIKGRQS